METLFDIHADYVLEDEVALLRPLQVKDALHLHPFVQNEPDIWRYSLVPVEGIAGMNRYISDAIQARATGREYPFIIYDKRVGRYAGSSRLYDINQAEKSLQLGYTWYGAEFRRTGLNRHCKLLLLTFAFEQIGMERVEFRADHDNKRSIAAMQAIGCTVEGVLRSHVRKPDGSRRDSIILSILKDEWFERVKTLLTGKTI